MNRGGLIAGLAGIALGLLSLASDYVLPGLLTWLGNVAGTWLAVAFVVGAAPAAGPPRRAAVLGLVALVAATVTYYVGTAYAWDFVRVARLLPGLLVWGTLAVLAGPALAAAGAVWRQRSFRDRTDWWLGAAAVAILAGPLTAEGLFRVLSFIDGDVTTIGMTELLVGLALPPLLLRSGREAGLAYAVLAPIAGGFLVALWLLLPAIYMLAGSGHL